MQLDAAELAVARALRYLALMGVKETPETRSRVETIAAAARREGDDGLLDRVFDALPASFELEEPDIPCPVPEVHRASMGYPEP